MGITDQVTAILEAEAAEENIGELSGALANAERMADEFKDIKPKPYVVPIERFVGLPILGESKLSRR